ncbi:MAG: hypothetical protein FJ295_18120 [Planctomycetes bacterium]|nr:hypothetical protein [Planctomycetota bacterium]
MDSDKAAAALEAEDTRESIFLVPYPKIVFLYPTFLVAVVAALVLSLTGRHNVGADDLLPVVLTWIFLAVLGSNLIVLVFDFPRATSLTLFFLFAAIVLGVILTATLKPGLIPAISHLLQSIRPVANSTFYNVLVCIFLGLYAAVFVSVRFDYWEVRHNELLHHHGMLSDLKRYASPNLRIDKEINDIFEYMLLRSGRLILRPSGESRDIMLDNVLFINRKETAITHMLGTLKVEMRPEKPT